MTESARMALAMRKRELLSIERWRYGGWFEGGGPRFTQTVEIQCWKEIPFLSSFLKFQRTLFTKTVAAASCISMTSLHRRCLAHCYPNSEQHQESHKGTYDRIVIGRHELETMSHVSSHQHSATCAARWRYEERMRHW